jgi:hypothetical protein
MTTEGAQHDAERRALELLPWYVNGTLEGNERELVSRQLLASLPCRKEFERLRRLQSLMQRADSEDAAAGLAFERLMNRIHAVDSSARKEAVAGHGPRWVHFAIAASLFAAVAMPLGWWGSRPETTPRFETLSHPPADAGATRLRVLFAPGVAEAERAALFARHGLMVVSSPVSDGVVTLELPAGADPAAVVATLKRDPRVRLVTSPPALGKP